MSNNDQLYTTYIKTTPEKLWEAITNPEFTRQYWGGMANISDWKKGSTWQHHEANAENTVRVVGKVLESTPPKRLVLSWSEPGNELDASTVTFAIEPFDGVVCLTVLHADFKAGSMMAGNVAKGWPVVLSSMKSFMETGASIDMMGILKGGCAAKGAAA